MRITSGSSDYQYLISVEVYPVRINWAQIAEDMKTAGVPYSRQGLAIGKTWSSYQRFIDPPRERQGLEGSEPRFCEGQALLILHSKICGIELTRQRLSEAESTT